MSNFSEKYRIDKNVLFFNLFNYKLKDYLVMYFSIVITFYFLPFIYYLIFRNHSPILLDNYIKDKFYLSICLILFPFHAVIIKHLWHLISKLVYIGIEYGHKFMLTQSDVRPLKIKFLKGNSKVVIMIIIPVFSIILAILLLLGRGNRLWWGNNNIEHVGTIIFLLSMSFIFYQLICHNVLGLKAIRILNLFSKLKPQINFWQIHNDYFFIGFQNIFLTVILSSLIHALSIYALFYYSYFEGSHSLVFIISLLIFMIFGPLFWYYPIYLVHKILNEQKILLLDDISKNINLERSSNDNIQHIIKYEIINNRKTWLFSLPVKVFTVLFYLLQITGISFSLWVIGKY